jgi:hypothetical protein
MKEGLAVTFSQRSLRLPTHSAYSKRGPRLESGKARYRIVLDADF